jgi:hypothetical protein
MGARLPKENKNKNKKARPMSARLAKSKAYPLLAGAGLLGGGQ